MDFKSGKKSITSLFSCKKQFVIPRFQREYTWSKVELNEFLDDILSRIKLHEGKLDTTEYFWGSLLLVGDLDDQKTLEVNVVDGQQRITTMTIFLSVIAKLFDANRNEGLSHALWEYIIGKDANTESFAVLKNETPKPYFQFTIQKLKEEEIKPSNAEEEKILEANKFFKTNLSKNGLKKRFQRLKKDDLNGVDYIELLKTIRDQLLRSYVICISTEDKEYANMIFEILNAKGKELASVDLIKNSIFEKLKSEVPADTAKELWLQIRNNLCSRGNRIEFATFFRHFWIMRYGKVQDSKLYSDFQNKVKKTEDAYLELLREMKYFSEIYSLLLNPQVNDFECKKEYNFIITELNSINNYYGIVQIRPVLMSLYYQHIKNGLINLRQFKKIVIAISRFHLIFNVVCSKRTSSLEKPINSFAHDLFLCNDVEPIKECLRTYIESLTSLLPNEDEFVEGFKRFKFSKQPISTNVMSKHLINVFEMLVSKSDIFEINSSIEHILDEDIEDESTLCIGNLLLLEQSINSSIPKSDLKNKKIYYEKSKYKMVSMFLEENNSKQVFCKIDIEDRSKNLAKEMYKISSALIKNCSI